MGMKGFDEAITKKTARGVGKLLKIPKIISANFNSAPAFAYA